MLSVNCQWSNWGDYTSCTKSCGGGKHIKRRSVIQNFRGKCRNVQYKIGSCNIQSCVSKPLIGPSDVGGKCPLPAYYYRHWGQSQSM